MQIKSTLEFNSGIFSVTYNDSDSFSTLAQERISQVYGIAFSGEQMVVVFNGKKNRWTLPGGSRNKNETPEECLKREMQEETNMRIINLLPVGYQEVVSADGAAVYQLRFACTVESIADFVSDPDESITEIKLIDPKDYKKYFDWGEIGERLVARALEIKNIL